MGAAKQRGSFEERKQLARDRIDAEAGAMAENLKKLTVMEEESEKMQKEAATKLLTAFLAAEERRRLSRMGIRIGSPS